jgi:hypothetical protein
MKYLVISAGDGSFESVVVGDLEAAIHKVCEDFCGDFGEDGHDCVFERSIRNEDNWDFAYLGSQEPVRTKWNGEQCYYEIIAVTQ